MEVSKWKEIWGKKLIDLKQKIILDDLIKADGFDTGVGSYDESSWRRLVADIQSRINVKATENVLEIGCGGGALLFALNEIVKAHYYGVDYSESLIQIAKRALPNGQFVISEAKDPVFQEIEFDAILSHGVFIYFPHHDYVDEVLTVWCKKIKSGGKLVLMDLNDVFFEDYYILKRKSAYSNPSKYEEDYNGLNHLFFDKLALKKKLEKEGMVDIKIFPHSVPEYGNSEVRFNIICSKT